MDLDVSVDARGIVRKENGRPVVQKKMTVFFFVIHPPQNTSNENKNKKKFGGTTGSVTVVVDRPGSRTAITVNVGDSDAILIPQGNRAWQHLSVVKKKRLF